jgi:membrane protein implicated in regulation of membrane protease activity
MAEVTVWTVTWALLALAPVLGVGSLFMGLHVCGIILVIANILLATCLFALASFSTAVAARRWRHGLSELRQDPSSAPAEAAPGKDPS